MNGNAGDDATKNAAKKKVHTANRCKVRADRFENISSAVREESFSGVKVSSGGKCSLSGRTGFVFFWIHLSFFGQLSLVVPSEVSLIILTNITDLGSIDSKMVFCLESAQKVVCVNIVLKSKKILDWTNKSWIV